MLYMEGATVPVKLLPERSSSWRLLSSPNSLGIIPLRLFVPKFKFVSVDERLLMDEGIEPNKLFRPMFKTRSFFWLNISSGILSVILFPAKSRISSAVKWLMFEGSGPCMVLELRLRDRKRKRLTIWVGIGPVSLLFWSWRERRKDKLPMWGLMDPVSKIFQISTKDIEEKLHENF